MKFARLDDLLQRPGSRFVAECSKIIIEVVLEPVAASCLRAAHRVKVFNHYGIDDLCTESAQLADRPVEYTFDFAIEGWSVVGLTKDAQSSPFQPVSGES